MPFSDANFVILDSVDSTNNYAMQMIHERLAKDGDAFFAYSQTHGKGQRGNVWQTGERQNIALSIVIQPYTLPISRQFRLSLIVSLACHDFFSLYAGEDTSIKWPNDLYWRDRKTGGVLIENVLQGLDWKFAIAGIGININQTQFDPGLLNPVSLKQITGNDFNLLALAKELHQHVLKRHFQLEILPFEQLLKEYNSRLYGLNKKVLLKKEGVVFETMIKGVSQHGQLITVDSIERRFNFGEVEWEIHAYS